MMPDYEPYEWGEEDAIPWDHDRDYPLENDDDDEDD